MEWIDVEVVVALPELQRVVQLRMPKPSCVQDAIAQSGLLELLGQWPSDSLGVGIYGKQISPTQLLKAGDRVEIYRPLYLDPKEARRVRARQSTKSQ